MVEVRLGAALRLELIMVQQAEGAWRPAAGSAPVCHLQHRSSRPKPLGPTGSPRPGVARPKAGNERRTFWWHYPKSTGSFPQVILGSPVAPPPPLPSFLTSRHVADQFLLDALQCSMQPALPQALGLQRRLELLQLLGPRQQPPAAVRALHPDAPRPGVLPRRHARGREAPVAVVAAVLAQRLRTDGALLLQLRV